MKTIIFILIIIILYQKAKEATIQDFILGLVVIILVVAMLKNGTGSFRKILNFLEDKFSTEQEENEKTIEELQKADAKGRIQEITVYEGELKNISKELFIEKEVLVDIENSKLNLEGKIVALATNSDDYKSLDEANKQQYLNTFKEEIKQTKKISEYHEIAYGFFDYGIDTEKAKIETVVEDGISVCKIEIPESAYTISVKPEYNSVIYGRFVKENALNTEASIIKQILKELEDWYTGIILKINGYIDRPIDKIGEDSNQLLDAYENLCKIWLMKDGQKKFLISLAENERYRDFDSIVVNGLEISGKEDFSDEELINVFGNLKDFSDIEIEGDNISFYYRDKDEESTLVSIVNGSIIKNTKEDPFEKIQEIREKREKKHWVDMTLEKK